MRLLAEILAPDDCLDCGAEGALWCSECVGRYPLLSPAATPAHLDGLTAAADYGGTVKEVVHALKYERCQPGADALARLILRSLPSGSYDTVTAVPASPGRLRRRGYSQAELIAKSLAGMLGLPYRPLLVRLNSGSQIGAGRGLRYRQVQGAFAASKAFGKILLVDDVLTTGATLSECAKALKAAGADSVWGAVAARH